MQTPKASSHVLMEFPPSFSFGSRAGGRILFLWDSPAHYRVCLRLAPIAIGIAAHNKPATAWIRAPASRNAPIGRVWPIMHSSVQVKTKGSRYGSLERAEAHQVGRHRDSRNYCSGHHLAVL